MVPGVVKGGKESNYELLQGNILEFTVTNNSHENL
jgi:hypothetical protein